MSILTVQDSAFCAHIANSFDIPMYIAKTKFDFRYIFSNIWFTKTRGLALIYRVNSVPNVL